MMKKKGVSAIVATVGLILLTFVAIGIIAGFIVPFVKDNLNKGTECVDYKDYFTFEEELGYNCKNISGEYWVSVRGASVDSETANKVGKLRLSFLMTGDNEIVEITDRGNVANLRMLNGSTTLFIPKRGEVKTYIYNSSKSFSGAEVYPTLVSGRACGKSDEVDLNRRCQ
jgi:hypothetical protein